MTFLAFHVLCVFESSKCERHRNSGLFLPSLFHLPTPISLTMQASTVASNTLSQSLLYLRRLVMTVMLTLLAPALQSSPELSCRPTP